MFLPAPDFFCDCLKLNVHRLGRLQMARVVDRGEPCVRKWHRDNNFPPEAVEKWLDYLGTISNGEMKAEIDAAMDEPFRAGADAFKWRMFCQGILANEDAFLPYTFGTILLHSGQWLDAMSSIVELEESRRLACFKERLLNVEGPRFNLPEYLQAQISKSCNWKSLRPALIWLIVESFIYFLAMAEVECLWLYYRIKEPKLSGIVLPRAEKGKVRYPVKLFFGYFFDNLVSRGFHSSLEEIYGKMPRIEPLDKQELESGKNRLTLDKDSGAREVKRAKYQGKAPALETFRGWVDALISADFYPTAEDRALEKRLLCDALGAARIVEAFVRKAGMDVPEMELVARFESYEAWHRFHSLAIIDNQKERLEKS